MSQSNPLELYGRFRGYYPVVIDVETAGFNAKTDALLELAVSTVKMDEDGVITPDESLFFQIEPFEGANLEQSALEFNGINPSDPNRETVTEKEALNEMCQFIRKQLKAAKCQRAVIVAHNAAFDHGFISAAIERNSIKRSPFHPFVTFDTTSMAGLILGQTVLIKACQAAKIEFDNNKAHNALYDTQKTTELFCYMVNRYKDLGGLEGFEQAAPAAEPVK